MIPNFPGFVIGYIWMMPIYAFWIVILELSCCVHPIAGYLQWCQFILSEILTLNCRVAFVETVGNFKPFVHHTVWSIGMRTHLHMVTLVNSTYVLRRAFDPWNWFPYFLALNYCRFQEVIVSFAICRSALFKSAGSCD